MIDHHDALTAVNTYLSSLVSSDHQAIVSLYAHDATVEDPVGSDILRGTEAITSFYQHATAVLKGAELLGDIRVAGDEVAFPFEITADLGAGIMKVQVIDLFHFNTDEKVDSMRAFWDQNNMKM
ncbi:MAG: nuclear transport factor 2 family protein [Porticoccaceae bacterium]|nr:nuclear transport factor 2 family protein [Porticoccaceae bacterium]